MRRLGIALAAAVWAAAGCSSNVIPDSGFFVRPDALPIVEVGVPDAGPDPQDAINLRPDLGLVVIHDAGAAPTCNTTCDCPQGLGCIDGRCQTVGLGPVYCCDNPGCPEGRACLDERERPGECPPTPDAGPDAGPRDSGGGLGAACVGDQDCDQNVTPLTCLEEFEFPFLWGGYCTVEGCQPGCPVNSICVIFGDANNPMTPRACMASCVVDGECRDDAYCRNLGAASVCFPDCRDDVFDCAPRNGSVYCDRMTGQCEPTPMQNGATGDECTDSRDCGPGGVCLGQFAWGLNGGLCSKVCTGLPEATPCGPNETCQMFGGLGFCFRNCDGNMMCPNRPNAMCGMLDPSWGTPQCIP